MLSTVLKLLGALLAVYALVVLLAWRFQEWVAMPGPSDPLPSPTDAGVPKGVIVQVTTSDGVVLKGWYLEPDPAPGDDAPAPGLVWFYGNFETVNRLAPVLQWLRPPGVGMLILDYRGYGQSNGKPTEEGLYRDAEAAWTFITSRSEIDTSRIAVYGRSLGTAVALYLATEHAARVVVLDSPFSSSRDMARVHYPFLPRGILRLKLDNVARAGRLTAPMLVFHGTADRIAPLPMGRAVTEAGRGELILLAGSGHNDTYTVGGEAYRDKFHAFLREHLDE